MVLIADDDELLGALLCHQLGLHGVQAMQTSDGLEVLGLVEQLQPRLVLLDLMLPGIDGFDVLRELKQRPETRATHVIILSPRTMERDVETALALGAQDYVAKPFDLDLLVSQLQQLDALGAAAEVPRV
jgi:two-component system OmpR family response regulator/two-component system alkaline phosphatase synthesis response regulator PhoP